MNGVNLGEVRVGGQHIGEHHGDAQAGHRPDGRGHDAGQVDVLAAGPGHGAQQVPVGVHGHQPDDRGSDQRQVHVGLGEVRQPRVEVDEGVDHGHRGQRDADSGRDPEFPDEAGCLPDEEAPRLPSTGCGGTRRCVAACHCLPPGSPAGAKNENWDHE